MTLIAHAFTILSIGPYFGFVFLNDLTADTRNCSYSVRVIFAAGRRGVRRRRARGPETPDRLDASGLPAPATATFNDVSTSHPFFQFVEALAKSGITGGCSAAPPLFCPDQPLTRAQMAAFLAKGLGLQWP